jgi:hypothetical protein
MLRLRVPLGAGESPASFCSRLASRTGAHSVRDFCLDMGFTFQSVVDGELGTLEELSRLGGCDHAALVDNALRRTGDADRFDLHGQTLRKSALRRSSIRACPACLADDMARWRELGPLAAYGRAEWQIIHFRTCPVHGTPLVQVASDNFPHRVHDFSLLIRPTLERIGDWMSGAVVRKPSGLETYLRNRLHGLARRTTDWLDSLPFHAVARLCEVLGAVALHGPQVKLNAMTDDDWWEVGDIGYDALADGPDGLRGILDRLATAYWSRKGDTGPKALFGRLYEWLAHEDDEPDYEPVREVIANHVMDTMPVGPGNEIFGKPITERRLWSVHTASRQTGAHPKRLRKLLAAGGFIDDGSTANLSSDRIVFPATPEVSNFLGRVEGAMSLTKAGVYVNAPRVQIGLLNDHGIIKPFVRGGGEDIGTYGFARRDLDEFLSRLTTDATELTEADTGLMDIPTAAKAARCSAVDIVSMVLDRRLTRVRRAPGIDGYMSVLLDVTEVRRLLDRPSQEGLTLKEAKVALKCGYSVVSALVKNGWLPSRRVRNPVTHFFQSIVFQEDLERFTSDYVSLYVLAGELNRSVTVLKAEIDAAGIHPAFDPVKAKTTFYRRSDLPPL